ncbi:hypothetical protein [Rhodoferax sp.]|uniref:hypothetical protein n=1 Tax=Rhodoferax sp. TaxID=50421 RepID=UPI0027320509|nr:hypothetical protein [Rhodoferax sp.]
MTYSRGGLKDRPVQFARVAKLVDAPGLGSELYDFLRDFEPPSKPLIFQDYFKKSIKIMNLG